MELKVVKKQITCKVVMILYFCDDCGIQEWSDRIIPKKRCEKCGLFMDHEEWEG